MTKVSDGAATLPAASVEDRVQVALMLSVGLAAASFSWSHVIDLAEGHGQAGWRAWVVALVLETAAVSGGLEVRRRRRGGQEARWAMAALVAAVVLQVAAQVAMAEATPWGVVLAVVPAVVFLLLVKIALARMPEPHVASRRPARVATGTGRTATPAASQMATAAAGARPPQVATAPPDSATRVAGGGHPALAIVATMDDDPVADYLADPSAMTYAQLATRLGVTTAAARSRVRTRLRQEARSA